MAIEDLLAVVPPPERPLENEDGGAWELAQSTLGTRLPNDFLAFGCHYGTGAFTSGIAVMNPLSPEFESSMQYMLARVRDKQKIRETSYEVFPRCPGLLPWGGDDNGNKMLWLTEGETDEWPVILESHDGKMEQFDMSMTSFLSRAFTNEVRPAHMWVRAFNADERRFIAKLFQ